MLAMPRSTSSPAAEDDPLLSLDRELASDAFFDDPYPVYARFREESPVHWSEHLNAWFLTRYDDVRAVLLDPERFLNAGMVARLLEPLPEAERVRFLPFRQHYEEGGLVHSDPPPHTRLRALVVKAFTPRIVMALPPFVQGVVDRLIDAVEGEGQMDVIADLARPLPAIVSAELLGVRAEDRERFAGWAADITTFAGTAKFGVDVVERAQRSVLAAEDYLRERLAERRRTPRDDLLSALVAAEEHGEALSERELLGTCTTLVVASAETTTNLIGNGLQALLVNPDQLQRLREDASLFETAIEEMLRYDAMTQSVRRVAAVDARIGAHEIRAGQLVYLMLGAANRDPAHFPDPERLDLARPRAENRHLAFGQGIHFCLGAPLARLEAQIAFDTLLRRLPGLRPASDRPAWKRNLTQRGLGALPVRFERA
jgi:cytochrome P450